MNESTDITKTPNVPPVIENLHVDTTPQSSERWTKRIVILALALLLLGGGLRILTDRGQNVSPEATVVSPPAQVQPQPASAPKGKDFGF
jgi:hypothetical protein